MKASKLLEQLKALEEDINLDVFDVVVSTDEDDRGDEKKLLDEEPSYEYGRQIVTLWIEK